MFKNVLNKGTVFSILLYKLSWKSVIHVHEIRREINNYKIIKANYNFELFQYSKNII